MRSRLFFQLSFIALLSSVVAFDHRELAGRQYGYGSGPGGGGSGGGGGEGNDDNQGAAATSSSAAAASSPSATALTGAVGATTGDKSCGNLMCVTATKNSTSVEYILSSTGQNPTVGWMGMGFGTQMTGATMIIMWSNSDGTVTISQRKATGEQEPDFDSNPPRVATVDHSLTTTSGSNVQFAFTLPINSDTTESIIYAFGGANPGTNDPTTTNLQQHLEPYTGQLDLTKALSSSGSPTESTTTIPLTAAQKLARAHGIVCSIGFLLLLPAGALLARYLRTFSNSWFKGHWILQFLISGPVIVAGIGLAIATSRTGGLNFSDDHTKSGWVIFSLYLLQCSLGGIIHFVKPKGSTGRPPQNYLHAVVGILIIGLAFYQVRTGFTQEWQKIRTSDNKVPNGVNILWYIWVIALPILYAIGLAFLPKQYKQEAEYRSRNANKHQMQSL